MTPKGLSDSFGLRSSAEPSSIAHLSFCLSTAKVGKTSLIMSLVSEEFPNVVRNVWKCNVWRCNLLIPSFVLHSFVELRFPIELRRSPFLLTSRRRGSPHTLWTIQVLLKHVFLLLCQTSKSKGHTLDRFFLFCFLPEAEQTDEQLFQEINKVSPCALMLIFTALLSSAKNPVDLSHRQMWFVLSTPLTTRTP